MAPSRRGAIGALAEAVFQERYGGLRGLRSPDFALLARLLGGGHARARGELLSFVLFDEVFIERLLRGRPRRRRALARRLTRVLVRRRRRGRASTRPQVSAEAVALDEFRARRRH